MERELRLIELYSHQFREAHRLLNEEIGIPGSTEIDGCLENLEAKWDVLFRLYDVVIKGSEIEQMETQVHAMEDFRSQYLQIRRAAGRKKEKSPSTSTSSSSTATPHHVLATAMAKLTATKVPTFSGETVKWPEFWGVYELTVHQQRSLPVLEKFIKLKESLKGEAASVIEGLPLTTANYTAAIDLLTQHYGSAEVIIQENFRYLHNLPVVPPGNHSALKQFLFNSEIRLRSLESLGVPPESYVISFVPLLVDRLPKNVRTAWYRSIADKEEASEVGDVLAFLRKEVISQERSQTSEDDEQLESENESDEDHTPESGNIQEYDVPDEDAFLVDRESKLLLYDFIKQEVVEGLCLMTISNSNEEEAPKPNNTSSTTCKEHTLPGKTNNICQYQTYVYFGSVCIG
ncbi:uncharacterized protein LOC124207838 [Daphnia pulex]|uniref:uncharacterized protein LOC124207838 n=1 Tax=Daphnia pulex TaxID=6669 RepID=UPI001EDF5B74|nr:uncharacterized protein LOC124207838 [Daphnia pulex]